MNANKTETTGTPYTVPTPPAGTTLLVRSRVLESGATELKRVEAGATGTYSPFGPLQFFTAFGPGGEHLGTWSPGYPSCGWETYEWPSTPGAAVEELLRIKQVAGYDPATAYFPDGVRVARHAWRRVTEGHTVTSLATL